MIAIAGHPIVSYTAIASLADVGGGRVVAQYQDGTVLSVQPNGSFERRLAGTAGPYEQATQTAQGLIYQPTDAVAYLVPVLVL